MWMHRFAGAPMRSIGKPASSLGAPTSALRAALRFGLRATPHPERCLPPHAMAGFHSCGQGLASTYAGRVRLRLPAVHGSSAAVLPAGTLPPPLLSAPTQLFSTSTGTGDKSAKPVKGGKRGAAVVRTVVLVKVGDGGKYLPFFTDGLMGKNISELLKALTADEVFGLKLQGIDLSGCSVFVFKLPAGSKVPTAADEADASELEGADTVGAAADSKTVGITAGAKTAGIKAGSITKNDQICIRVRLPAETAAIAPAPLKVHDSARKFTVNGAIEPILGSQYFLLRPDVSVLMKHFDDHTFFFLYGPRGSGKTTTALHALAAARERGWYGFNIDLGGLSHNDVESFWLELGNRLSTKANEWKLKLQPISSASTFQRAFSTSELGTSKVVLMFDEFDALSTAALGVEESFLGALRSVKQDLGTAIQSIFAVGPFNILSMESKAVSPFNVREDLRVPFLTEQQVVKLLAQFATARELLLEDGIAADVYRLTKGHAGLVCACGKALDTPEKVKQEAKRISIAAWHGYSAHKLKEDIKNWSTVARMIDNVERLPAEPRRLLETAVFHGIDILELDGRPKAVLKAAAHLATEGWLLPLGGRSADTFAVTSPLVRSLALNALVQLREVQIKDPLPLVDGVLDFGAVVAIALRAFEGTVMRDAAVLSSKQSRATLPGVPSRERVPKEAVYHSQFFAVTKQWFSVTNHADVYDQADVEGGGDKEAADVLVVGRLQAGDEPTIPAPKHIVEFVASNNSVAIKRHYDRTIRYMDTHRTDRGTCITFTAVRTAADVDAVMDTWLAWPSVEQLFKGMDAVHVVHDMAWSRAVVFSLQRGRSPTKREVALLPAPRVPLDAEQRRPAECSTGIGLRAAA